MEEQEDDQVVEQPPVQVVEQPPVQAVEQENPLYLATIAAMEADALFLAQKQANQLEEEELEQQAKKPKITSDIDIDQYDLKECLIDITMAFPLDIESKIDGLEFTLYTTEGLLKTVVTKEGRLVTMDGKQHIFKKCKIYYY